MASVLVPAARADHIPGFRESVRLSTRASVIVGQPVRVYCTGSRALWESTSVNDGGGPEDRGIAFIERGEMYLAPWSCQPLEGWLRGKPIPLWNLSDGLHTFIHESVHLRGTRDENEAECGAEREVGQWARTLFGVKKLVILRKVVSYVEEVAAC